MNTTAPAPAIVRLPPSSDTVRASGTGRWTWNGKPCGCKYWSCGQASHAGGELLPNPYTLIPQDTAKSHNAQPQAAQPVQAAQGWASTAPTASTEAQPAQPVHSVAPAAPVEAPKYTVEEIQAYYGPKVRAYNHLTANAGVGLKDHTASIARPVEQWTWEWQYNPLERALLRFAEDTNNRQVHFESQLYPLLNDLIKQFGGFSSELREIKRKFTTVDALADVIQVLSGAKAGRETVTEGDKQPQVDFSDLPPLVDHEGRLVDGEFAGMPPLLDTATGELIYSDADSAPAAKRVKFTDDLHTQWGKVIEEDAAKAWDLFGKFARQAPVGTNPEVVCAQVVGAWGAAAPQAEAKKQAPAQAQDQGEIDEPFEAVHLEDLNSTTSVSSAASTCTLEDDPHLAASSRGTSGSRDEDLAEYVNGADSDSSSDSSCSVATSITTTATANLIEVTPSSAVVLPGGGEHSAQFERVLAELQVQADNRRKRTRSVFEVFGAKGREIELSVAVEEEEEKMDEDEDEDIVEGEKNGDEGEEEDDEDDETRLLRLQLRILEAKLKLAKAMKRQLIARR
ncbi:hypothetical protein JCM6882_005777 [Rhodosporidiobolus microsporus]